MTYPTIWLSNYLETEKRIVTEYLSVICIYQAFSGQAFDRAAGKMKFKIEWLE